VTARPSVAVVSAYSPADFPGGAERAAWEEARLLAGERPVVFVSSSEPAGGDVQQVRIGGWLRRLHDPRRGAGSLPAKLLFHALLPFNPVTFVEALAVFRRVRPGVVHTHNLAGLSPSIWLAARLAGARVVHTHHDPSLICQRATMTRKDGSYCGERAVACLVCRTTRLVKLAQAPVVRRELFPGRWLRERLGRHGPIVRPCADGDVVPAPSEFTALFLGQLVPAKGIETLVRAAERANVRLVVAGWGPLAGLVRDSQAKFVGQVDEPARAQLLAEASVVVIPSIGPEAAPLVFFEALAAGVPAVLSDLAGLTELAEYGSAVLVPPGDVPALADALAELARRPERLAELRQAAVERREVASPERFRRELSAALEE
jgi:glycosyltransferase involved in cell wall biosynthesis